MVILVCDKCGNKIFEEVGDILKIVNPVTFVGNKMYCECGKEFKRKNLPSIMFKED